MSDLYAELILDHAKRPRGAGLREPFHGESHRVNATCGDDVTLRVEVNPSGVLCDVSYLVQGCAISQASTSVLYDLVIGRPLGEVQRIAAAVQEVITGRNENADDSVIGDAIAFHGVAKYPARIRCALLGWSALAEALTSAGFLDSSPIIDVKRRVS
ncbi:MAG: Fe-S cluster assembly sulfur transfer protein SufU [Actinomycetota bacterium]